MQKNIGFNLMGGGRNASTPFLKKGKNKGQGEGGSGGVGGNGGSGSDSEWWIICFNGKVIVVADLNNYPNRRELEGPFPTKEEAEKAVKRDYPDRQC